MKKLNNGRNDVILVNDYTGIEIDGHNLVIRQDDKVGGMSIIVISIKEAKQAIKLLD